MTLPVDAPLLYTPRQAAELLGLATSTLSKMRLRGDGPAFLKLGASVRYPVAAVEAYVAAVPVRRSTAEYPTRTAFPRGSRRPPRLARAGVPA
jgi:predicted DNA-binding transcriptional regulator AlpA